MKLLEFKRIEDKSKVAEYFQDLIGTIEHMVWLENDAENTMYEDCLVKSTDDYCWWLWYGYMSAKLDALYNDDDIFYYFSPNDKVPEVGEKWEFDGVVFQRIK